jgi:hypothetical protein
LHCENSFTPVPPFAGIINYNKMEQSNFFLRSVKNSTEEIPEKIKASKLIKTILVIFMLSWIILLSSCALFISIPADRHEGHNEHHGHK